MFINFKDINESDITLAVHCIWGITIPQEGPGEVLLEGANKSVKTTPEVARDLQRQLRLIEN